MRHVLKRARQAGVAPGVILSSPYKRALPRPPPLPSTCWSMEEEKLSETRSLIPDASPGDVWEEIRDRRDESAILLASHEPLMSTLAVFLLNSPALRMEMKKAALARIECEHLGREPRGVLKWLITPAVS